MFRKMTLSMAVATACMLGSQTFAQTENTGASPKVQLAAYTQNYSSGCVGCSQGAGGGGYGAAGYGGSGGPNTMAFGQAWGGAASSRDSARFYHYPYVYYPQNFQGEEAYRSSDSMYYRYQPQMQIPVYNRHWHNYYPSARRYHQGHQFILDVF